MADSLEEIVSFAVAAVVGGIGLLITSCRHHTGSIRESIANELQETSKEFKEYNSRSRCKNEDGRYLKFSNEELKEKYIYADSRERFIISSVLLKRFGNNQEKLKRFLGR